MKRSLYISLLDLLWQASDVRKSLAKKGKMYLTIMLHALAPFAYTEAIKLFEQLNNRVSRIVWVI
jgi:hypothetical protein